MTPLRRTSSWSFVMAVQAPFWLASNLALAAGHGAAAEHEEPHVANWWGIGEKYAEMPALGWLSLTFLVFVALLLKFGRQPLKVYLETRADVVEKAMAEAARARDDAERRARAAESKLAALDSEVRNMKADFEVQGKAEAVRIEQLGADMSKKIAKDAEDTIAAEVQRARELLRAEASKLALQIAEQRIKALLSDDDEARLKKSLINDLVV